MVGTATWALLAFDGGGAPAPTTWGALAVGDRLGEVTVVAIHHPHFGAVPIVMRTGAGVHFQVDVLARDPQGPRGVAETAQLSLFVANRGDGSTSTDETQGLAVMALAARLGEVQRGPELLTLRERTEQYPHGSFGVPLS